jgi:dolichyl-phosphate-mannose-protein mannosyltransferase
MVTSRADPAVGSTAADLAALRARLVPPMPGSAFWGWAGPLLVTVFGTYLRFYRLSVPHSVIFDETYYVPDALGILKFGTEHNYIAHRNALLVRGDPHIFTRGGEFVVHPPFGKILIAAGEWIFGLNPFGWRFAVAVVGSLSILILARTARRMTRSTLLGCVAGLLLSLDGLEFVMSRTALLDIFVMFWVLAAFACVVADRDWSRARLADAVALDPGHTRPPRVGFRWWLLAAGVCVGLATASKWNGIWFIPAFIVLTLAWDRGARQVAGYPHGVGAYYRSLAGRLVVLGVVPLLAYLATWSGWFATSTGYDREYGAQHGIHNPVLAAVVSLYEYHKGMLAFNTGLEVHHPYESKPWTWLFLTRPVSYYWCPDSGPHPACPAGTAQEVLAIGTPLIWWTSVITLLFCLGWWLARRDWRAGAVLLMVAAGWLPWFAFASRTQFYFYAVAFVPFLVLSITLCLGLIIGPARASPARRAVGAAVAGAYLLGVLANFAYLYPVLAAQVIPYTQWLDRMWYHGWI